MKKVTVSQLFLSGLYCVICFFVLAVAFRYVLTYLYTNELYASSGDIYKNIVNELRGRHWRQHSLLDYEKIDERKKQPKLPQINRVEVYSVINGTACFNEMKNDLC